LQVLVTGFRVLNVKPETCNRHATLYFLPCLYYQKQKIRLNEQGLDIHKELIDRCRMGDQDAHFRLYKLYSRAMYNVGFRITGNEEDAEDVLQESFVSAFKNLESYRGDATFGAWLKRIVVNKAINVIKKRKENVIAQEEDFDVPAAEPGTDYMPELSVDKVRKCIEMLPDGYRSVLSLYLLEGYDHEEIAGIMGITESTSKSQLNRAKGKLKELLIKK
jgi:RNA polymerase sigma factor (sigma-70 family)